MNSIACRRKVTAHRAASVGLLGVVLGVAVLGALLLHASPALADPQVSLSISPSTQTVSPGQTFQVDVTISTDTATRGAQGGLSFDPDLVEVIDVTEGSFYSDWVATNGGSTLMFPEPEIDNEAGHVSDIGIAIVALNAKGGPSGGGVLWSYQMRAKDGASGTSNLTLSYFDLGKLVPGVVVSDTGETAAPYEDPSPKMLPGVVTNDGQVTVGEAPPPTVGSTPTTEATSTTVATPTTAPATSTPRPEPTLGAGSAGSPTRVATARPTTTPAVLAATRTPVAAVGQLTPTGDGGQANSATSDSDGGSGMSWWLIVVGIVVAMAGVVGFTAIALRIQRRSHTA